MAFWFGVEIKKNRRIDVIEFGYHRVGLKRLHGHRRKTVDHALGHHPHSRSSFPLSTLDETFFPFVVRSVGQKARTLLCGVRIYRWKVCKKTGKNSSS